MSEAKAREGVEEMDHPRRCWTGRFIWFLNNNKEDHPVIMNYNIKMLKLEVPERNK